MAMQGIVEMEIEVDGQSAASCASCGSASIRQTQVRSAFWHQDRLVVVENVPVLVCDACHEQFYDDITMVKLDLLRGDGFPIQKARGEIVVPVFALDDRSSR